MTRKIYNNLFGENFSWGADVRHIATDATGYIASIYENGTCLMLAKDRTAAQGSIRVGEDFLLYDHVCTECNDCGGCWDCGTCKCHDVPTPEEEEEGGE